MIMVSWTGDSQGSNRLTCIWNTVKVGRWGKASKKKLRKPIYLLCLLVYKEPAATPFNLALRQRKTSEETMHSSKDVCFARKLLPRW